MLTHLHAEDYTVRDCPLNDAVEIVKRYHYAKGSSNTAVYRHGLYHHDRLVGVAIWLPPTKVAAQSVNPNWQRVINLTRLAIAPEVPTNGASFLLGKSMRLIRRDGRFDTLLTYADTLEGHTGAIYRATNWDYLGLTKPSAVWVDENGKRVARKSTRTRNNAEMLELGHRYLGASAKHKFVKHLRGVKCK